MTLVELVLVMVLTGILAALAPPLVFYGVKTVVFLPRALAVNQAAGEILHQLVEGGFSTLSGQTAIRGLRFAMKGDTGEPALWLVEANRIGFVASDGQRVLLGLAGSAIKRDAVSSSTTCSNVLAGVSGETLPYHAPGVVQITTTGSLFVYYDNVGSQVIPLPSGCPPATVIRRVDITLTAQTGSGLFDEGQARESITTSVAIRVP